MQGGAQTGAVPTNAPDPIGRRRLGELGVSAVGIGVQNMSRRQETTLPYRPEMINLILKAFDRGVPFCDAAFFSSIASHWSVCQCL